MVSYASISYPREIFHAKYIDVEIAVVNGDEQSSALWAMHTDESNQNTEHNSAFAVTGNFILQDLSQGLREPASLLHNLGVVSQKLRSNMVPTIRRLELEILQAGKVSRCPSSSCPSSLLCFISRH